MRFPALILLTNLSVATPVGIAAPPATDARFNVFVLATPPGNYLASITVSNLIISP